MTRKLTVLIDAFSSLGLRTERLDDGTLRLLNPLDTGLFPDDLAAESSLKEAATLIASRHTRAPDYVTRIAGADAISASAFCWMAEDEWVDHLRKVHRFTGARTYENPAPEIAGLIHTGTLQITNPNIFAALLNV